MLLSIIVPVYNTAKYLEKCLDSIVNQTLKDIEIIVINDGSKDQSDKILEKYEKMYPEILRVIRQTNHGIGYTRNQGIQAAKGKYITFIDSDDAIEPEYCEKMCQKAEAEQLDFTVCDYYEVYEATGEQKYWKVTSFDVTNLKESPRLLFDINISPWNKIYKTELLRQHDIRFPEKVKYEDTIFVLKYMAVSQRIGKVDEPLVDYLIREGSETTMMDKRVFDIFYVLEEVCSFLKSMDYYANIKEYLEWFCVNRISVYNIQQRFQREWKDAEKFIEEGFQYLEKNFPGWRKNRLYLQNNGFSKRVLKSNKLVMKLFVKITGKAK